MKGFPQNARVCFIGDSITHNNDFVSYISAYYHEHLKDRNVNFYNCGVAGGRVSTALPIMEKDVFSHNPTHAVIMFGINDSDRSLLQEPRSAERYDKLVDAYHIFGQNLREMCRRLRERNVEIILCTQTPYDEYQEAETSVLVGGFSLMAGYAQAVREIARELGVSLCDYHSYFSRVMQGEALITPDRVHPNEQGQFHIAKCFLSFQGYDLGDYKPLPAYMDLWRDKVKTYRNIWAAEKIIINKYDLPVEEQMAAIEKYVNENAHKEGDFCLEIGKQYLQTKHQQEQLNEKINYLMEVEFKNK